MALLLVTPVIAIPITGSLAFNGTPNFDATPLAAATATTSYNSSYVAFIQQTGDYASVPNFFPVTFSPFTFSPASQSINPLWTFDYLGLTYSARVTSMASNFNSVLNIWNFGGTGVLSITGYDDTLAAWNFSTGQIGKSFYFGSAAASNEIPVQVPDRGATVGLAAFGLGLIALSGRAGRIELGRSVRQRLFPLLHSAD